MIPVLTMVAFALVTDVPGLLLFFGGWTMAFSMIVGAIGVFIGMKGDEKPKARITQRSADDLSLECSPVSALRASCL